MMTGDENYPPQSFEEAAEENRRLREENQRLKALLNAFSLRPASAISEPKAETRPNPTGSSARGENREKIRLFRSYFRGRQDVYARRWESKKGASGYSPACGNEWHPLLCKKPCARCDNKKYLPITDDVIHDHVLGKATVGIYPLLPDETCFFLAVDFDKKGWERDAAAYLSVAMTWASRPHWRDRAREMVGTCGSSSRMLFRRSQPANWAARSLLAVWSGVTPLDLIRTIDSSPIKTPCQRAGSGT